MGSKKHDKKKYENCRYRIKDHQCMALKDTYCDYEDCKFYKTKGEKENDS